MTPQPSDWRHLAEQASNEMDPEKLMEIVTKLDLVLSELEEKSSPRSDPRDRHCGVNVMDTYNAAHRRQFDNP